MDCKHRLVVSFLIFQIAFAFGAPPVIGAQSEIHRGDYLFGHEVRTYQPCGSDKVFWVNADKKISQQLREQHRQLTIRPYQSVYGEVKGHFMQKATAGFAADYDRQIFVESIDLVRVRPADDCSIAAVEESITGIVWKWRQTLLKDGQLIVPDAPDRYTVAFQPDGRLSIRADCNRVGGNYTLDDTSLAVETTFSTRAMCPPDSLDQTFLKHLNAAAIYFIRKGALQIDLQGDTGTMKFSR